MARPSLRVVSPLSRHIGQRSLHCRLWAVLLVVIFVAGCWGEGSEEPANASAMELLSQPLWTERDAYDAAHHLMVPMHAAFARGRFWEIERFASFFSEFRGTGAVEFVSDRFHRLQFLYLYGRFISLLATQESCSRRLLDHHATALSYWIPIVTSPAWQWDRSDFPTLFDRVRWKLDQDVVAYSYYRAITDEDLYGLAIGADLAAVASGCSLESVPQYAQSIALAREVFSRELTATAPGGWVFQKGVWTDHPDYAYAGHQEISPNLQPLPVPGISPDTSHSFRLPLFLVSFACAEEPGSQFREFFVRLSAQLAVQWSVRTLIMPDASFRGVRMTNYMDGENGVYRYGYVTQGPTSGFGPYELSGSFNLGWWSFVGQTAEAVHASQLENLPFPAEVISTYVGPNTTRVRNPAFTEPGFYQGVLISDILEAARVVSRTTWCP